MKILFIFLVLVFSASEVKAQAFESEATMMGLLAGAAEACGAGKKLDDYELIAGNILLNKAPTIEAQKKAVFEYALAKIKGNKRQKNFPIISCEEFLTQFAEQDIFMATVYQDGTVKLSDGTIIPSNKGKPQP